MTIGFLDIFIGDENAFTQEEEMYQESAQFFKEVAPRLGLQDKELQSLNQEERELVESSSPQFPLSFNPPTPLNRGRMYLSLSDASGLSKTRENFVNLLTGSKGFTKADKTKKLSFQKCLFFRVEKDFVIQTGDVTRNDGSGGEASIGSGVMKAESHGLGINPTYASLCMANSGRKDSITSQFFIVTTDSEDQLKKLSGRKYVNFGNVICRERKEKAPGLEGIKEENLKGWKEQGSKILKDLSSLASDNGTPSQKAWIGDCGVL